MKQFPLAALLASLALSAGLPLLAQTAPGDGPGTPTTRPATKSMAKSAGEPTPPEARPATPAQRAGVVKLATYNVENFREHFLGYKLLKVAATQPVSEEMMDGLSELRRMGDEKNWATASTILNADFSPDILVIEECCNEADLQFFNKRWLEGAYETVMVLPTNTERDQNLGVMLKPGFKVLEEKSFHDEMDPTHAAVTTKVTGGRLFARGPGFLKVQTPGGATMWVGVTHQKSKSGNSVEVTEWRLHESRRTHEILVDLAKQGLPVVFMGDMNDELHYQEYELEAGGDCIGALAGDPADGITLATRELADSGEISFGGYYRGQYRSMIDHILTANIKPAAVQGVKVFKDDLAKISSDHYPVEITLKLPPAASTQPTN